MSSGQRPRNRRHFPRMKVRGARRRFKRGGIASGVSFTPKTALAVTECVLHPGDHWRCVRTDPAHLATLDHHLWEAMPILRSTYLT